jgi:hypothetical protein
MTSPGVKFEFTAIPWQYPGPGGWYFVSLPDPLSAEIRDAFKSEEEGWGRLKAIAKIGSSEWKTAIWFDGKQNRYLLPLKAEIRRKENITEGKSINVIIWV